jgi:large subunit ribosomal protein L3
MGAVKRTEQSLEIVRIDAERNLLLIRGAVPGSRGGDVMVRPAVRARRVAAVKQGGKAAAAK